MMTNTMSSTATATHPTPGVGGGGRGRGEEGGGEWGVFLLTRGAGTVSLDRLLGLERAE